MKYKKHPYAAYQFQEQEPENNLADLAEESSLDDLATHIISARSKDDSVLFDKAALDVDSPIIDDTDIYNDPLDTGLLNRKESAPSPQDEMRIAVLEAALNDEKLRMLAEMDNFKKRIAREKEEQVRYASEAVLADLLPSLDNFELALSYGRDNEACREMLQGLEMSYKLLLDALAGHGLEKVGQVGEEFNPEIHEALTRENRDDMPPGHVAQLFQPGYRLRDRLLRPAKVVVSA